MSNPLLWLGLSILLLAVSLTALLFVSIPTLIELARVARSAEKLLDLLNRELPPTLQALKRTGSDLGELADEVTDGMQHAHHLVKQVDQSLLEVRQQAQRAHHTTRGVWVGVRAAWQVFTAPSPRKKRRQRPPTRRPAPPTLTDSANTDDLDSVRSLTHAQRVEGMPLERSPDSLKRSSTPEPDFDPWSQRQD